MAWLLQERTAAADALSAIHDLGVLHGDILPRNLMVQRTPVCNPKP